MNRREFLRKHTAVLTAPPAAFLEEPPTPLPAVNPPANSSGDPVPPFRLPAAMPRRKAGAARQGAKGLNAALTPQLQALAAESQPRPAAANAMSGLAPYTGAWGPAPAAHLLRRCLFGPTRAEIDGAAGSSLSAVLDQLLAPAPTPFGPLTSEQGQGSWVGGTWIHDSFSWQTNVHRTYSLQMWWTGLLLGPGVSVTERMTLFWHNHFVTDDIANAHQSYNRLRKLRAGALGNFRTLTEQMTIDEAMLWYLSGAQNVASAPNENYARELMELFTLGKGPLAGAGNYTTYTEDDVKAAARVLTGWEASNRSYDPADQSSGVFRPERHDQTTKQFSAAFQNRRIAPNGAQEYKNLIAMIFEQPAVALFLCRKLYRWFVYYNIDEATEYQVIRPLAELLRASNYEVAPVLRALLGSAHFYDVASRGCLVKSPADYHLGLFRQLEAVFPPVHQPTPRYRILGVIYNQMKDTGQDLLSPPVVAGWPAYYQAPQYNELWATFTTLPLRQDARRHLFQDQAYHWNGGSVSIDLLALTRRLPPATAANVNLLVDAYARLLLPAEPAPERRRLFKEALLDNLPDLEWTIQWNEYLAAPSNTTRRQALLGQLIRLVTVITDEVEYQLY
ncbi:DUF1800 family protein [uncultured Hymenobacter sp.]|uniref:DUF1800 domain-containing protein n=1 Tax=uncultured Hymenobacter sp. TaxID=170016 RepID=UPI0035CB2E41